MSLRAPTGGGGVPRAEPVVVVEPEHAGHRMVYFVALAAHCARQGRPVALATSRAGLDSPDLARRLPAELPVEPIDLGELSSADAAVVATALRTVARLQAERPDCRVVVTEGDKFLPAAAAAALAGTLRLDWARLTVLVMRAPRLAFGPRALLRDTLKAAAVRLARARGATVRVLAPAGAPPGRHTVPDPIDVEPDAAPPPELARLDRGARTWIGVTGHVSPRKNLDLVLDAATRAGADRFGVLVAGRVTVGEWERCAAARERLAAAGGRLVALDRLLDDGELDATIRWADLVVLAHSAEGPSGILGRAAALGTPVLAAGARTLRRDVARLGAGRWTPLRVDALARGLAELAADGTARSTRPFPGSAAFARALLDAPIPQPRRRAAAR